LYIGNRKAATETAALYIHAALPICHRAGGGGEQRVQRRPGPGEVAARHLGRAELPQEAAVLPRGEQRDARVREQEDHGERERQRSEEHTSELQSREKLVWRRLHEKK